MMRNEKDKIMEVAEKYADYFNEQNADIAIGRKGPHFFYTYDEKHKCFDVFNSFETAEELEMLIVGTLAEDLECINSVMTEELSDKFNAIDVNEHFNDYEPKFHMHILEKQLEVISEQFEHWSGMMTAAYKSLRDISRNLPR